MAGETGLSDVNFLILGTLSMLFMVSAVIAFALLFQRKLAKKAKAYREIEQLMQKQELRSAYQVIEGQERERKRIAAELHDNVGSLLATLKIYSDLSLSKSDPAEVKRLSGKVNQISTVLSDEVRKLSHELDLRTLLGFGLKPAVEHLCEALNDSGKVQAVAVLDIPGPLNSELSVNLYRIVQELVTNTLKHASASAIRIEIAHIDEEITLIYEDNGEGFDLKNVKPGIGMQSIRSRVDRMNGKLTVDSSENGTTYILELANYE